MGIGDRQQHVTTIIGIACAKEGKARVYYTLRLVLLAVTYFSVSETEGFKFSYFK